MWWTIVMQDHQGIVVELGHLSIYSLVSEWISTPSTCISSITYVVTVYYWYSGYIDDNIWGMESWYLESNTDPLWSFRSYVLTSYQSSGFVIFNFLARESKKSFLLLGDSNNLLEILLVKQLRSGTATYFREEYFTLTTYCEILLSKSCTTKAWF